MLDEMPKAITLRLGKAIRLSAGKLLDILGIIVADKGAKATLVCNLSGAVSPEADTVRVHSAVVGAVLPGVHDLKGLGVVLRNDEASVEEHFSEFVLVLLGEWVDGKGKGVCFWVDVPVVHEPFKG